MGPFVSLAICLLAVWCIVDQIKKHRELKEFFMSAEFQEMRDSASRLEEHAAFVKRQLDKFESDESLWLGFNDNSRFYGISTATDFRSEGTVQLELPSYFTSPFVFVGTFEMVRSSVIDPFGNFCKYFNVSRTAETIEKVDILIQKTVEHLVAVQLVNEREAQLFERPSIPDFAKRKNFLNVKYKLGIHLPSLDLRYQTYRFLNVSPSGEPLIDNTLEFNLDVLEQFRSFLEDEVERQTHSRIQRSRMTQELRDYIKIRDNFTCQLCGVSQLDETNLLLEIDHIVPVSKGGLTEVPNLQTLCWKCNRSKANN